MSTLLPDDRGWCSIEGNSALDQIESLQTTGRLEKVSLTGIDLVTVRHIRQLSSLQSIEWLWLWCDVTRRAMRHVVQLPGLASLDVLSVRGPGEIGCFSLARTLREFRANLFLTEQDLFQISKCEPLEVLGAQNAAITTGSLAALLSLPNLRSLDIEATGLDDRMAKQLGHSKRITSLDIGATKISGAGLRHIVKMESLKFLDLWATSISEEDLFLVKELPNLEYLSIGNYYGDASYNPQRVISLLMDLPSLKSVWIDGIALSPEQVSILEAKVKVRYTNNAGID